LLVIDDAQYSYLIAAVIGSAVVPTLIADAVFLPFDIFSARRSPTPRSMQQCGIAHDRLTSRIPQRRYT
jgi:hypothetical protein